MISSKPSAFSFIDDFVCGSARPWTVRQLRWLRFKKGISSILTLTEGPISRKSEGLGFDLKHVPIKNHCAPSIQQVNECLQFITMVITSGRRVLVHCSAGKGRTGTILAAYLIAKYGLSGDEAIEQIRKARKGSIENETQAEFVMKFAFETFKRPFVDPQGSLSLLPGQVK